MTEADHTDTVTLEVEQDSIADFCIFHAIENGETDINGTIKDHDIGWMEHIVPENVTEVECIDEGEISARGEFTVSVPVNHIPATRHSPPETEYEDRTFMFDAVADLGDIGYGYLRIE